MELQDQFYVLCGACAGVFILLFVFIGYLMYRVAKITELLMGKQIQKRDTYAYNNPTIVPGEELNRRGFQMQQGSAPSSFSREAGPASLPRVDAASYNDRNQTQNDFSNVLDNNEIIFGGDRPSNLMNRNKIQQSSSRNYDYNNAMVNENFSFQSQGGRNGGIADRQQPADSGPKSYLNERMNY